jgi:2-haloacid dehalogenase
LSLAIRGTHCRAVAAGWKAALIRRSGNDLLGVGPQPQFVGADLNDVADQLIAQYQGKTNVA